MVAQASFRAVAQSFSHFLELLASGVSFDIHASVVDRQFDIGDLEARAMRAGYTVWSYQNEGVYSLHRYASFQNEGTV